MFLARVLFFKLHESPKFLVASKRASAAVVSLQKISRFNGTNSAWALDDVVDDVSSRRVQDAEEDGRGSGPDDQNSFSLSRSPSINSIAFSQAPLLDGNSDPEASDISSYAPSDFASRPQSRPEWINRLPRSWRSAATDYSARVHNLLEGKWRAVTLLIWAIWTLASAGYTVSRASFLLSTFEQHLIGADLCNSRQMFNVFLPKFLEQKLNEGRGGSKGEINDSLKDCECSSS